MSMIEVAERRGDIPRLIDCLFGYSFLLNTFERRMKNTSGLCFANEIRSHYYCGEDTNEGMRNGLMADVAEKYVKAICVHASGESMIYLDEEIGRAYMAWKGSAK